MSFPTVVRLHNVMLFHDGIVVVISFTVLCFGCVFFHHAWFGSCVFFLFSGLCKFPVTAVGIVCCGLKVTHGRLFAMIVGLCFSLVKA